MNSNLLFDAITEIDDELIEKALEYRPVPAKGKIYTSLKIMSGLVAAAFVLIVGNIMFSSINATKSAENMMMDSANMQAQNVNGTENGKTAPSLNELEVGMQENVGRTEFEVEDSLKLDIDNAPESIFETTMAAGAQKKIIIDTQTYIVAGELDGYMVCVMDNAEEYIIYIIKDAKAVLLEDAGLTSVQLEQANNLVKEFLEED